MNAEKSYHQYLFQTRADIPYTSDPLTLSKLFLKIAFICRANRWTGFYKIGNSVMKN